MDSSNDTGGPDDTLRPTEALDSDDVRNDDGDEVVDPPDGWSGVDKYREEPDGESLDEKLAAEEPDTAAPAPRATDVDHVVPGDTGTDAGQVSGTPEDGESLFPIVEE